MQMWQGFSTEVAACGQAGSMDWQDEAGVGRRAQSLTQALDEVERFPPPEATLQTQHYITEARGEPRDQYQG